MKTFKCRSQFLVVLYPRPSAAAAAGSKIDFNGNSWRGLWSGRRGGDRVTIKSKFVSYISTCNYIVVVLRKQAHQINGVLDSLLLKRLRM